MGPSAYRAVEQVLARQPWNLLDPPLLRTRVGLEPALARLREYARRLLEWNRTASNLISRHDEPRLVERHLLESVEPAHWLIESGCRRWVDFGSGGGLPAIPLAIAGVGGHWTLVESRRSKTLFMRKTLSDLSMKDFDVVHARLEDVVRDPDRAATFDGFTSRATMRIGPTLSLAKRLVQPGGSAFLWKGSGREEEMVADESWREAWEFVGLLGVGSGPTAVARFLRITKH